MKDCILCKATHQESLPAGFTLLAETEFSRAFLYPQPINCGHMIFLPKNHHPSIMTLSEEEHTDLHSLARKCAKAMIKCGEYDGFHLLINQGECAGQMFEHAYIEVIPRIGTDGFHLNRRALTVNAVELADTRDAILKKLKL